MAQWSRPIPTLSLSPRYSVLRASERAQGRSKDDLAGLIGGGRRRRDAGLPVYTRSSLRPWACSLGALPRSGCSDLGKIWSLGFAVAALLLLWSELRVEVVATTPPNKVVAVCCFFDSTYRISLLISPSGHGGEGRNSKILAVGGSGSGRGVAASLRVHSTDGWPTASSSPSSPLSACLGGEGNRGPMDWHAGSSAFFSKRSLCCSCCPLVAPTHLAGLGGEEVDMGVSRKARASGGSLWEPLEFRLSTVLPP
jgi:hypothetical protein